MKNHFYNISDPPHPRLQNYFAKNLFFTNDGFPLCPIAFSPPFLILQRHVHITMSVKHTKKTESKICILRSNISLPSLLVYKPFSDRQPYPTKFAPSVLLGAPLKEPARSWRQISSPRSARLGWVLVILQIMVENQPIFPCQHKNKCFTCFLA